MEMMEDVLVGVFVCNDRVGAMGGSVCITKMSGVDTGLVVPYRLLSVAAKEYDPSATFFAVYVMGPFPIISDTNMTSFLVNEYQ